MMKTTNLNYKITKIDKEKPEIKMHMQIKDSKIITMLFKMVALWLLDEKEDVIFAVGQQISNFELIADAFNVTNETGMTPRELQESHAELLEALKSLNDSIDSCVGSWDHCRKANPERAKIEAQIKELQKKLKQLPK